MIRKNKVLVIIISYLLVIALAGLISAYSTGQSLAAIEVIGDNVGLSYLPYNEKLFDISGMYPGKTEKTTVTITNEGPEPFTLSLDANMTGDAVLFDVLRLKIVDQANPGVTFYQGLINEMGIKDLGSFTPNESRVYDFELTFLPGKGNVTQNRAVNITWTFAGVGSTSTVDSPGPGTGIDPGTGIGDIGFDFATLTTPDFPDTDSPDFSPDDADAPLDDAPVDLTPVETAVVLTDADDAPEATETDELAVAPEAPQVAPDAVEGITATFNYWPLLLLLLIPALLWFILSRLVLVLVPDSRGDYKTVARKLARRKEKRWFINLEKELDKHLVRHGLVVVDFRGGLLKKAHKLIYTGEKLVGSGDLRYAMIGSQQVAAWSAELKKRAAKAAG